jgi:hypothetical protein
MGSIWDGPGVLQSGGDELRKELKRWRPLASAERTGSLAALLVAANIRGDVRRC